MMGDQLQVLPLPPEGWGYSPKTVLVGGDTVVVMLIERLPPTPSKLQLLLDEIGLDSSDGIVGLTLSIVLMWKRIQTFVRRTKSKISRN